MSRGRNPTGARGTCFRTIYRSSMLDTVTEEPHLLLTVVVQDLGKLERGCEANYGRLYLTYRQSKK